MEDKKEGPPMSRAMFKELVAQGSFRRAARAWRQSRSQEERGRLWEILERFAAAGSDPFEQAWMEPCAFQEAVSSGSIAAVDLMARSARAAGLDVARGLNETDCSPAFGRRGETGESILKGAWLCGPGGEPSGWLRVGAMVDRLLELGADPEGLASAKGAPLASMAGLGLLGPAMALIKAGADPSRRGEGGETTLHAVVRRWDNGSEMWRALVAAGADPSARNDAGQTPEEAADPVHLGWLSAWRESEALRREAPEAGGPAAGPERARRWV